MKKQLFLLATIPMILLSSCGTSTQIVDYNHYLLAAKNADVEAEKVTLTKKTVDGAGKIFYKDNTYTFTLHEEYDLNATYMLMELNTSWFSHSYFSVEKSRTNLSSMRSYSSWRVKV